MKVYQEQQQQPHQQQEEQQQQILPSQLPARAAFAAMYHTSYNGDQGKTRDSKLQLRFQPNYAGWTITGEGHDDDGPFYIKEGVLRPSGRAYWIEKNAASGEVLSSGTFDQTRSSFKGTWLAGNGVGGYYTNFQIEYKSSNDDDVESGCALPVRRQGFAYSPPDDGSSLLGGVAALPQQQIAAPTTIADDNFESSSTRIPVTGSTTCDLPAPVTAHHHQAYSCATTTDNNVGSEATALSIVDAAADAGMDNMPTDCDTNTSTSGD